MCCFGEGLLPLCVGVPAKSWMIYCPNCTNMALTVVELAFTSFIFMLNALEIARLRGRGLPSEARRED